jgi:hypothetical protein
MTPPMPTTYKETLLRETREELARADTKASILLGASAQVLPERGPIVNGAPRSTDLTSTR